MQRAVPLPVLLTLLSGLLLGGCISLPPDNKPAAPEMTGDEIEDAVPRPEPYSKLGNPPSYTVFGKRYVTLQSEVGYVERGIASWYGPNFHGKKTSSGEPYDMHAMTGAHTTLPIPCYVQVTNLETGKRIVVRVNDRGPFMKKRVIDLSKAAAIKLGITAKGTGLVEVSAVDTGKLSEAAGPAPGFRPVKGDVYIQVGAFSDPANAERTRIKLASALEGQPVRIEQNSASGTLLYRVQTGPYRDIEEIDRLEARITQQGMETYIIID